MKKITSYILLALTLLACERDLNVPFPEHESKMVVNAFLDAGKPIDVYLSRSYGTMEILDNVNLNVEGAVIELFEDGNSLGLMSYADTLIRDTLFDRTVLDRTLAKYHIEGITAKAGKTYALKASHPKYPAISSQTRVPGQAVLSEVELLQNVHRFTVSEGYGEFQSLLRVNIQDPAGEKNFYRVKLEIELESPGFPDSKYRTGVIVSGPEKGRDVNGAYKTDGLWLSDEGKDGQSWVQDFVVTLPNASEPLDQIEELPVARMYVTLYSANEDSYQYLQKLTLQAQSEGGFDLFPPEAIVVYSNVEGGYGIFGGLTVERRVF